MTTPYDLVIVGLGSAGLAAAEMAAGLELRVAAIERDRPGGHRLWSGDVPVAALAATAPGAGAALGAPVGVLYEAALAVLRRGRGAHRADGHGEPQQRGAECGMKRGQVHRAR